MRYTLHKPTSYISRTFVLIVQYTHFIAQSAISENDARFLLICISLFLLVGPFPFGLHFLDRFHLILDAVHLHQEHIEDLRQQSTPRRVIRSELSDNLIVPLLP